MDFIRHVTQIFLRILLFQFFLKLQFLFLKSALMVKLLLHILNIFLGFFIQFFTFILLIIKFRTKSLLLPNHIALNKLNLFPDRVLSSRDHHIIEILHIHNLTLIIVLIKGVNKHVITLIQSCDLF